MNTAAGVPRAAKLNPFGTVLAANHHTPDRRLPGRYRCLKCGAWSRIAICWQDASLGTAKDFHPPADGIDCPVHPAFSAKNLVGHNLLKRSFGQVDSKATAERGKEVVARLAVLKGVRNGSQRP